MSIDRAQVDAALAAVTDPNTGKPFAAAKGIKNVSVDGAAVSAEIVLGYPAKSQFDAVRSSSRHCPRCPASSGPRSR